MALWTSRWGDRLEERPLRTSGREQGPESGSARTAEPERGQLDCLTRSSRLLGPLLALGQCRAPIWPRQRQELRPSQSLMPRIGDMNGDEQSLSKLVHRLKRTVRDRGWEVRRADPQASLDFLLQRLLDAFRIDCVLDVGAHKGEFAVQLRRGGFNGRIISFEPVPASFQDLCHRMNGDGNWCGLQHALGAEEQLRTINVPAGSTWASFLDAKTGTPEHGVTAPPADYIVEVPVRRLDAVVPDLAHGFEQLFLKIDTQGFDLEVLKGSTGILDLTCLLQMELSFSAFYEGQPDYREALDTLDELGFEPVGFYPVVRADNWAIKECDGVFVRKLMVKT